MFRCQIQTNLAPIAAAGSKLYDHIGMFYTTILDVIFVAIVYINSRFFSSRCGGTVATPEKVEQY